MQPWFNRPSQSILDKQSRLKVTIYGPYGQYAPRLESIAYRLRQNHGFTDTCLVKNRNDFRKKFSSETDSVFSTMKSYHYLSISNVNIFVFYCGSHGESAAMELQYICQKLRAKIPCCSVIKDTSCKMPGLLTGQIEITKLLSDEFNGRNKNCDDEIVKIAAARCMEFLTTKFHQIP